MLAMSLEMEDATDAAFLHDLKLFPEVQLVVKQNSQVLDRCLGSDRVRISTIVDNYVDLGGNPSTGQRYDLRFRDHQLEPVLAHPEVDLSHD